MRSRSFGVLLWFCLSWLALPSRGHAWTEAHVREAQVSLGVSASAPIEVALDLTLEVRGGWLERLELPGLDEGLVLAEHEPAFAVLENGERVPAQITRRGATLLLKFARRDGLRRGVHHLHVRYSAPRGDILALAAGRPRLRWTLPGFEAGLGRASIAVRGPRGMGAVADPDLAQELGTRAEGAERVLTFSRLHVPRASPWTVSVDLPGDAFAAGGALAAGSARAQPGSHGTRWPAWSLRAALLCLAGFLSAWSMRARVARVLRAQGALGGGLVSPRPLGIAGILALAGTGAVSFVWAPPIAVAAWSLMFALAVPQARVRRGPHALGSFRPLTRAELSAFARARRWEWVGVPWADAATLSGGLSAAALALLALGYGRGTLGRDPWGLLALCSLIGFFASARSLRRRSVAEQVGLLTRAAGRARGLACGMRLVAYASGGRLAQPRLRLFPGARYPGLLRLELLVDTRRAARPLVLSALVESDSSVERWLRARFPELLGARGEGGRRVALLRPIDDVEEAVEALLSHLSSESQRALLEAPAARAA